MLYQNEITGIESPGEAARKRITDLPDRFSPTYRGYSRCGSASRPVIRRATIRRPFGDPYDFTVGSRQYRNSCVKAADNDVGAVVPGVSGLAAVKGMAFSVGIGITKIECIAKTADTGDALHRPGK
jgi:hypothetical protein